MNFINYVFLGEVIEMRNRNALLLAAVSVFALTMATTTNAAYQCTWTDGVKVCGNELGFAPSVGGEDRRDKHSGDHDSGRTNASGSSGSADASGSKGNNGGGNGGNDGSPNGKSDDNR